MRLGTAHIFPFLPLLLSFFLRRTLTSFIPFFFRREKRFACPPLPLPLPSVTRPASIFIVITNLIKFRASTSRTRGCVKHFN